MLTMSRYSGHSVLLDRRTLHSLGVLVPIRFNPVKLLPGRHPLGRAGQGMRLLRTRPYIAGEDNPRDIDKFSPPHERRVVEWEDEAQASITLLADVSASMSPPRKTALRNACLLQLTYSLWRAGDRVGAAFFDDTLHEPIRSANLRMQMDRLAAALQGTQGGNGTDLPSVLHSWLGQGLQRQTDLLFVLSDFVTTDGADARPETLWGPLWTQVRRNVIPVIISFAIPPYAAGMVKLWDPERRARRLAWLSPGRIRRINRQESDRVSALAHAFRSAGLDCMLLAEQRQIYPQLALLARARRLGKH
jgi:uncharacterized protein (DUF58 family)